MNAEYLKGLINVVHARGPGDRAGRFCIRRFAIQMYCRLICSLLHDRQQQYSSLSLRSMFFNSNNQVRAIIIRLSQLMCPFLYIHQSPMRCCQAQLNHMDVISANLCESFEKGFNSNVSYIRGPTFVLFDECNNLWLRCLIMLTPDLHILCRFSCPCLSALTSTDSCLLSTWGRGGPWCTTH